MREDDPMTDQDRLERAERRADRLTGFALHLAAFVIVNVVLFAQTGFRPEAGHFWGWGIGVAAHAAVVLGPGSRLRQQLVERELQRDPHR
jgi:hypothetical protein